MIIGEALQEFLSGQIERLLAVFVDALPNILLGISLVFIFWIISVIVKGIILRLSSHTKHHNQPVFQIIASTAKVLILLLGLISGLGTMGIDVNALVASLGLTGFALSFALKDILSNILSGILIIIKQPFRIADHIKVDKHYGCVKDINLRYTTLESEGNLILVPNTKIFQDTVTVCNSN